MTPFGVSIGVLLEHHTELNTGLLVTVFAEVAKTDHLCLAAILCYCR